MQSSKTDPKIYFLSALVEGSLLSKFSITRLRNISFFRTTGCGQVKPSLISSSGSSETGSVSELVLKNTSHTIIISLGYTTLFYSYLARIEGEGVEKGMLNVLSI